MQKTQAKPWQGQKNCCSEPREKYKVPFKLMVIKMATEYALRMGDGKRTFLTKEKILQT
jgi:hypothetical protein